MPLPSDVFYEALHVLNQFPLDYADRLQRHIRSGRIIGYAYQLLDPNQDYAYCAGCFYGTLAYFDGFAASGCVPNWAGEHGFPIAGVSSQQTGLERYIYYINQGDTPANNRILAEFDVFLTTYIRQRKQYGVQDVDISPIRFVETA